MAEQERPGSSDLSVSELVQAIQAERKLSRAEIAAELGRSPRMVGKLVNGEAKGESFRDALSSLRDRGSVAQRPARRRDKEGHIVPVRAKLDKEHPPQPTAPGEKAKAPTVVPEETAGRYVKKAPNRFSAKTTYAKNGDRVHNVTMSPTNKDSRKRGLSTLEKQLRSVTRSQARHDKRVKFTVTLDSGRVMDIGAKGGYFSSDVLNRIKTEFGGNVESFIMDQLGKVYAGKDGGAHKFTGVQMNVFDAKGHARHSRKK